MEALPWNQKPTWQKLLFLIPLMIALTGVDLLIDYLKEKKEKQPDELAQLPDESGKVKSAWQTVLDLEKAGDGNGVEAWHREVFGTRDVGVSDLRESLRRFISMGISKIEVVRFTKNTPLEFDRISDLRHDVRKMVNPVPLYSVRFYRAGSARPSILWEPFVVTSAGQVLATECRMP